MLLSALPARADTSEVADAAMKGNRDAVRALLQRKADANAPQIDGTTALHWAVRVDDLDMADMLIRAGANASAANREGVTPMQLAAMNGNAAKNPRRSTGAYSAISTVDPACSAPAPKPWHSRRKTNRMGAQIPMVS